jgi:carbonic anhydrase
MGINFNYNILKKAKLENVGYTLKLKENLGSVTAFNGNFKETYYGEEFHFHNPSEHTFNGMHYPLEMHIVHKSKSQGIEDTHCVLAIYFQLTSEKNEFLGSLNLKDLSEIESLNLHGFVEKVGTQSMYMYKGSLTTPPCTECVQWVSLNNAQNISEEQLQLFKDHFKMHNQLPNARGICPICSRIIHRKV